MTPSSTCWTRFLELLALCICQENDTIARIGSNCLQQLILQNVAKFTAEHWAKIVGAFCELFERTTAYSAVFRDDHQLDCVVLAAAKRLGARRRAQPDVGIRPVDEKSLKINGTDSQWPLRDSESRSGQRWVTQSIIAPAAPHPGKLMASRHPPAPRTPGQLEEFKPTNPLQQQPVVGYGRASAASSTASSRAASSSSS